jgi:hypothetical protein
MLGVVRAVLLECSPLSHTRMRAHTHMHAVLRRNNNTININTTTT